MLIGIGGGIAGGAAGGAIGGATGGEIGAHFGASVGAEIGMLPGLVLETIKGVKETIKQVRMMISNFKKDKENGVDAMNKYRVQCKVLAKDFAKQAQDAIKLVDKLEKEDKAADK